MRSPTASLSLLQEQHLERWGLNTYRSASFLPVPQAYQLAPVLHLSTAKGQALTVRASDIYGARLKGLASVALEENQLALTRLGEPLVRHYSTWLTTAYSSRYRLLTSEEHQRWLTRIVILVVVRHLLEHKWARTLLGEQAFADPWVGSAVSQFALLHHLPGELARLIHHVVRDPDHQHALMDQFFRDLDIHMQGHLFVQAEPLPSLPEGSELPLFSWFCAGTFPALKGVSNE